MRYCSGDGDDEASPWRIGTTLAWSHAHLKLATTDGVTDAELTKYALSVSLDRRLGDRWAIGVALGGVPEGALTTTKGAYLIVPGPVFALAGSYRPLDEGRRRPFVLLTGSLSGWAGSTQIVHGGADTSLLAFDVRFGVAAGKTFANRLTLYAVGRVFGGPIFWSEGGRNVVGTDAWHVQLGAGLVLRLRRFDLLLEGIPLGEQALAAGMGLSL